MSNGVQNLSWRIAAHLDELGWEGGHVTGKLAGGRRKWVDDDHYITVGLNNRYLEPSREFRSSMHQVSAGLTHHATMELFDRLFAPQGGYQGFVATGLASFGAPKYFLDEGYESRHGEHVEFSHVMELIETAHGQLVADHRGPEGMRTGVEKWNHRNLKPYHLLTLDAYEGWNSEAAERLASLSGDGNYAGFLANLTEYLGYDPLKPQGS